MCCYAQGWSGSILPPDVAPKRPEKLRWTAAAQACCQAVVSAFIGSENECAFEKGFYFWGGRAEAGGCFAAVRFVLPVESAQKRGGDFNRFLL